MTRYWRFLVPAAALAVVLVILLVNLSSSLVYFITPTELAEATSSDARQRLGGQVVAGTVVEGPDGLSFMVTDGRVDVAVQHLGASQDLFAEGVGVVLEGTWDGTVFSSDTMIIRHDEQYRTEDGRVYDEDDPASFDP